MIRDIYRFPERENPSTVSDLSDKPKPPLEGGSSFISEDEAETFFHQQRLQTLGMLAGGVAHDFNNILAGILGHITFLQAVLPKEGAHLESLEAITSGAKKASTLTQQILDFSKFDLEEADPVVDLVELVNSTAPLLRGALTSAVELTLTISEKKVIVQCPEGKLAQVMVNLVVNARDAIAQGGKVEVCVREALTEEIPKEMACPNGFAVLEVSDNGMGMSRETQERALEPYFSTKGDQGTGLGLATVSSIVGSSGGMIRIQSTVGKGTCFRVFLRRAASGHHEKVDTDDSIVELHRGVEHVLVVDDEEAVRSVVSMSLRHLGYEVTEHSDPREAQRLLQDAQKGYDLVVLDMLMPHLGGDELFFELRSLRPNLPVIIMSGYSEEEVVDRILAEPATDFLHKPFTVEDLSRCVREILDRKKGSL